MYEVVCITEDNREYTIAVEARREVAECKAYDHEANNNGYVVVRELVVN